MNEEIIIINDEPFYKILNGTSYDYAPIPKEFKPYFDKLQQENKQLQNNWNELKKWLEEEIYNIEPKGTVINYNCEYDSEEDYINAMKERSKLITLKRVLIMLQELEGKNE